MWAALQKARVVRADVELQDYVDADMNVIVHEELNDDDIIKSFCTANSSDVALDVPMPVTASQVMDVRRDPLLFWRSRRK